MKEMTMNENSSIVFEGQIVEANFVRNILEDNGLEAFVLDEHIGHIFPGLAMSSHHTVKVVVHNKDADKALDLIKMHYNKEH
jgi:hypothetical protein